LSASFPGVDGTALLVGLPGLALSSGSACSTGSAAPSKVLKAIGLSDALALSTLRFSVGRFTTEAEVDTAAAQVAEVVRRLRVGSVPAASGAGGGARMGRHDK
jgi:cysteine desulfurase